MRRKRIGRTQDLTFSADEIELEGEVQFTMGTWRGLRTTLTECEDCSTRLRSEWHRHPAAMTAGQTVVLSGVRLREPAQGNTWYLPTSPATLPPQPQLFSPAPSALSLDSSQESGQQLGLGRSGPLEITRSNNW